MSDWLPRQLGILPGHVWKICRSRKWQTPTFCQRFRYMEAAIILVLYFYNFNFKKNYLFEGKGLIEERIQRFSVNLCFKLSFLVRH